MTWLQPIRALRRGKHIEARLQIRDERAFARRLLPIFAPLYLAFGFVDWFYLPAGDRVAIFAVRALAITLSRTLFLAGRGRLGCEARFASVIVPLLLPVELFVVSRGSSYNPYFSSLALVMITATMLFPVGFMPVVASYLLATAPVLFWATLHPHGAPDDVLNLVLMTLGSSFVCALNSGQAIRDLRHRLVATETLARDVGSRDKEIRSKASELAKRHAFETQFSPQVVKAVLEDSTSVGEMRQVKVVMIVIDVERSTTKAKALPPRVYKEVIEEVFDVFSSACLRWDVTVDKFTGDGGQAFAGAPVSLGDDFDRAVMACKEMVETLLERRERLEARWQDPLNVRFAICEGVALVGFLGRGALRCYTAIGETVSFTHRLCAVPPPWVIASYSRVHSYRNEATYPGFATDKRVVGGLKGFGAQTYNVAFLSPKRAA